MWVYLEIEPDGSGIHAELDKRKDFLYIIHYNATCRSLSKICNGIEGLVIPDELSGHNYDVKLMILQIRLETTSGLQELPIRVWFDNEDRYCTFCDRFGMTERGLERIGVVLVPPDKRPENITPHQPKFDAVSRYLEQHAGQPWFTQGRHNRANRWGPYTFFRVLKSLDPAFSTQLESIEKSMFEEPFLKRLASTLRDDNLPKPRIDQLRTERCSLREKLLAGNVGRKILVVEDHLDDGWREVYREVFESAGDSVSVIWATNVSEAKAAFAKDIALIVLDVRLDSKDDVTESTNNAVPTGVTLAKWFREQWSPIPILAATASNKTWILEPLLKYGVQAYWVKESPEQKSDLSHAIRNVIDFYRKTRDVLVWSDRTRGWIEGLYAIAEEVFRNDVRQGQILEKKAKSLHGLLDRAFSPFSRDLDDGLQLNVAFLILFSCMNDLRAWCCRVEKKEDGAENWYTVESLGNDLLVSKRRVGMRHVEAKFEYEVEGSGRRSDLFPDTDASLRLLTILGCAKKGTLFRELKKIRNVLPLTHGVTDAETGHGDVVQKVTDKHLDDMLSVLQAVVDIRAEKDRV
ncbi:response regulator [Allochromatium palmeri]|uniref:Response regulator n=1 Tax=Allochromatium palmeri TaxID=231048 RepID=A0A6N8EHY7_9GAMM|nr:response regulator [Allochromatium palmeri]MTW21944.1 response regulator [Allochromatium palmeri]